MTVASQLEPSEYKLALTELVMRLCLWHPLLRRKVCHELDAFIWSHFGGKEDLKSCMLKAIARGNVGACAMSTYCDFVRGMRGEFYRSSPLEASIDPELNERENGIKVFYRVAEKSVQKEHFLVSHSVGLL